MFRSYELRLQPNKSQVVSFEAILTDSCDTYNAALQERRDAWRIARKTVTYYDQCAELTELRKEPKFATIALEIQREPLRRINRAFADFFRRCKTGQKPGFPRFKPRSHYTSFAWNDPPQMQPTRIVVPKVGQVKFKCHRPVIGIPKQVTVKQKGECWVALVVCDVGPAPPPQAISSAIGIDVGITVFATLSDGSEVENPRFQRRHAGAIAKAHRRLQRKEQKSKNRLRAKEMLRRAYQKVQDSRLNFCHHVSRDLVNRYDLVAHEALIISRMTHGGISKSIFDAAWGILLRQLAYKAESAGHHVVAVNPKNTTRKCSGCGAIAAKKRAERRHICSCGIMIGRDHNAALNILALGRSAAGLRPSEGQLPTTLNQGLSLSGGRA